MAVSSLVQWFGGNRMHAKKVGELLGKHDLVGVVFAGGLSELPFIDARQILVNDKHSFLYDLYWAVKTHPSDFMRCVKDWLYHPTSLDRARESMAAPMPFDRAVGYFIVNWLTRCSGGTEKDGEGSLAMRWTASGGSSIARWNAAIDGLPKWSELLRSKCECTCLDWQEFRDKWNDRTGHALYLDPTWIDVGDDYLHKLCLDDHYDLSVWANSCTKTTLVVRHSDHPLYRAWYLDSDGWEWFPVNAKNQAGNKTGEVLIRRIGVK